MTAGSMSAAVNVTSFTIARVGEAGFVDGAGVGAGVWPGVAAAFCLVLGAAEDGRLARGRGRVCAMALTTKARTRTKTKGDFRFITWIFLNDAASCQPLHHSPASCFTIASVSISSALLSGRSLTMRGKRKA